MSCGVWTGCLPQLSPRKQRDRITFTIPFTRARRDPQAYSNKIKARFSVPNTPSPILKQPSEYVVLHFQVDNAGLWSSPQFPQGEQNVHALTCGLKPELITDNGVLLEQLQTCVDRTTLLDNAPDRMMPISQPNPSEWESQWTMNFAGQRLDGEQNNVFQSSAQQQLEQQIKNGYRQVETSNQQQFDSQEGVQLAQTDTYRGRGNRSLKTREAAAQNYAQQSRIQQQAFNNVDASVFENKSIREGVTRPVWIKDKLLLIRRVRQNDKITIQGCWLDWEKIKNDLNEEIADAFPNSELKPVYDQSIINATNLLATLPVTLAVTDPNFVSADVSPGISLAGMLELSPLQLPLVIAWVGLILGSGAVAMLLAGVMRLSERRAAFVSAVTHELRTPLTTFRMYSEMLAEDMVPQDLRQQYTDTLRVEADRLSHLVDNVLQYARLETGKRPKPKEWVDIFDLLKRMNDRLVDRAQTQRNGNVHRYRRIL